MTKTKHNIEMAIHRIISGRPKITTRELSISSVAEEAGVSNSTIHNRYPELAEKIRIGMNKSMKAQRDSIRKELTRVKGENQKLHDLAKQYSRYAKHCPSCNTVKPFTDFYMSERDGLQYYCKTCWSKRRQ